MHGILGLRDRRFQSVYHFTVGGPVEDNRLRTLEPYSHRQGRSGATGDATGSGRLPGS